MKMSIKDLLLGLSIPAMLLTSNAGNAADIKERTIKLGYGIAEEHPLGQGVNRFAKLVSEKSGGKIKVKGYPGNHARFRGEDDLSNHRRRAADGHPVIGSSRVRSQGVRPFRPAVSVRQ